MEKNYRNVAKKITAVVLMMVIIICTQFGYTGAIKAKADDDIIATGYVNYDVTDLRIRTAPVNGSIITKVNGGFKFDIYEEVSTSATYSWYNIGFYLDGEYTRGYITSQYTTKDKKSDYKPDNNFEDYLTAQDFPESYKESLRQLHEKYPLWVFVADHNGRDWNTMVNAQNVIGRSLIYSSADSSWKSTAEGCYDWETGEYTILDSGGWVQASEGLVKYALDPRNFLDDTYIFMFESLSYDSSVHNTDGVRNIISGTFMEDSGHDLDGYDYATLLMYAGEVSKVSPYHLATRIIQEQGANGIGNQISGNVSGYRGYYNYYSQNAYASGGLSAVQNGLRYAMQTDDFNMRPWNTRYKAVVGGAINLGKWYINRGQDTIYYEKFDIKNFSHQYMTNVLAPRSEATRAKKAYSTSTLNNTTFKFSIPVYDNMPSSRCIIPDGNQSSNNWLRGLSVDGYSLTPTFSSDTTDYSLIVENEVKSIDVSASAADTNASVSGRGSHRLSVGNNTINIVVTAEDGGTRTYTINVVRKEAVNPEPSPEPVKPAPDNGGNGGNSGNTESDGFKTGLLIDNDKKIVTRIGVGSSVQSILDGITYTNGCYGKLLNSDNSECSSDDTVATGDKLTIYRKDGSVYAQYNIVIYGDVNGDGVIDLVDFVAIKRAILNVSQPEGVHFEAADIIHDGSIDLMDFVAIKRHILGVSFIQQD